MGLTATVSPSADFPVFPVIWPTLLHRFLGGARTVSPVARHALATVLPLPPRRSVMTFRSAHVMPCCLRPQREGSASEVYFLSRPPMGSLSLRPGDSLTIPWMALSVGFIRFVSSTDATQATRLLTLALVGLAPTEHVSLRWTHSLQKTRRTLDSSTRGFSTSAYRGHAARLRSLPRMLRAWRGRSRGRCRSHRRPKL